MKKVYILRGLSGSGKSALAESLVRNASAPHHIVSADHFFVVDGVYQFDPTKLQMAHNTCFEVFARAVLHDTVDTIIVDNTNSTLREYAHYAIVARLCGYEVVVLEIPCRDMTDFERFHARSRHGVPLETMDRMRVRWESDPDATIVE